MAGHLAALLRHISSRACVEVVPLSVDASVVRTLCSTLELSSGEDSFTASVAQAKDK